jgi:DNA repair exonuclease SbcCD ATPase subunit
MLAAMSKTVETPLLLAVRTLSEDLQHFEQLSTELERLVINSEKSLQRARKGLQECSEHEAKLAQSLRGFADAMQGMQAMQQRCMDQTAAATERIKQRQQERAQLQQRMQALADNARDVSAPVESLPDGAVAVPGEALAPLQEVARRLELVIAEAAEVTELARRGEWADLERDTHSLEQQLQSARNRVLLGLRKLASDAPS